MEQASGAMKVVLGVLSSAGRGETWEGKQPLQQCWPQMAGRPGLRSEEGADGPWGQLDTEEEGEENHLGWLQ